MLYNEIGDNMSKITSLKELYERITPALVAKVDFEKKLGIDVDPNDIWNYLSRSKWRKDKGLTISDMVNDIFNLDIDDII